MLFVVVVLQVKVMLELLEIIFQLVQVLVRHLRQASGSPSTGTVVAAAGAATATAGVALLVPVLLLLLMLRLMMPTTVFLLLLRRVLLRVMRPILLHRTRQRRRLGLRSTRTRQATVVVVLVVVAVAEPSGRLTEDLLPRSPGNLDQVLGFLFFGTKAVETVTGTVTLTVPLAGSVVVTPGPRPRRRGVEEGQRHHRCPPCPSPYLWTPTVLKVGVIRTLPVLLLLILLCRRSVLEMIRHRWRRMERVGVGVGVGLVLSFLFRRRLGRAGRKWRVQARATIPFFARSWKIV